MLAAAHDHFEYVTLIAALAVALGTFAAAGVGLFGPAWTRRRRRPALSIELDGFDEAIVLQHDPSVQRATLRLDNAEGRDRAEEVEVYVDVGWEFEPSAMLPLAEQELLPFGDPRDSPPLHTDRVRHTPIMSPNQLNAYYKVRFRRRFVGTRLPDLAIRT